MAASEAIDSVWIERAEHIRALARALVRDEHDAEDLAQDAWIAALTRRPASEESWAAWIATVMRNVARVRWRSDRRRTDRERDAARPERQPTESELLDRIDGHALLVRCVRDLDEPYRGAIVLRYFEGLTPKQIAERTDTPLRTVNTRLHRALALLRMRLDHLHRGNRDAWCALLVPLAGRSSGAAAGALIVGTPLKVAIAAVLVAGLLASYWSVERGAPGAKPEIAAAPIRAETDLPKPELADIEQRAAVEPPAATSAASPVSDESSVVASPPRRAVHGIVIDAANRPLPGIRLVTKGNLHDGVPADIEAISDLDGEFDMLDVPDGSDIDVASDGWVAVLRPQVSETSAALELVVVAAPRAPLAGDVVDELGAPIPGARVRILVPSTLRASIDRVLDASVGVRWETSADADGRFEFADAPELPRTRVLADREGYESEPRALESRAVPVHLVLRRVQFGRLLGTVVDEMDAPVAGATVVLIGDHFGKWARSSSRGEFELAVETPLLAHRVLRATLEGHMPALLECRGDDALARDAWPTPLVLKLGGAPLEIQGRLLTAEGAPAAGVQIANEDLERLDTLELFRGHFGFGFDDDMSVLASGGNWGTRSGGNATSAEGSFAIGSLRPGRYRLHVTDQRTGIEFVTDPIEAGSRGVELRLPRQERIALVAGRAVSPTGAPLAGVEVWLQHQSYSSAHVTTGESGAFEFRDVPRIPHELWIAADGFTSRTSHDLADERDLEHLQFVVVRRCHVQVDLTDSPLDADHFEIRDARDQPLAILLQQGDGAIGGPNWWLKDRKTPALAVTEDAATLVLFHGEDELRRVPLHLTPSELTTVRP